MLEIIKVNNAYVDNSFENATRVVLLFYWQIDYPEQNYNEGLLLPYRLNCMSP